MHKQTTFRLRTLALAIALTGVPLAMADTAPTIIFSTNGTTGAAVVGQKITQTSGTTQIRLPDGSTVSIVGAASYSIRPDGSFELFSGAITVLSGAKATAVHLPDGSTMRMSGMGSAGSITVNNGMTTGNVISGTISLDTPGGTLVAKMAESWRGSLTAGLQKTLGNAPVPVPGVGNDGSYAAWLAQALAKAASNNLIQGMDAAAVKKLLEFQAFIAAGGTPQTWKGGDITAILAAYTAWFARTGGDGIPAQLNAFLQQLIAYASGGGKLDSFPTLPVYLDAQKALDAYRAYLLQGGLPSAYTGLTAAQIKAILEMLSGTGSFNAYLNANNAFWAQYLTWIKAGNNPDLFAGLPDSLPLKLQGYMDELNLMYAYLNQGGLPSQYTALNTGVMKKYLSELSINGKLQTMAGAQGDFWRQYFAYLNNPTSSFDRFPQLPIFAQYKEALRSYYAFLAGGGNPSQYTTLTQAKLQQYVLALRDAGLLEGMGDTGVFFGPYYDYLVAGGVADQYPNLPGRPVIPSTVTFDAAVLTAANKPGQFSALVGSTDATTTLTANPNTGALQGSMPSTNGKITIPANATLQEHYKDADGAGVARLTTTSTGRFAFGAQDYAYGPRQGLHYAYVPALSNLPSGVIVKYGLLSATNPTTNSGNGLPGTFSADMAINFMPTYYQIAAEGTVAMPGDATYSFKTPGGLAGVNTTAPQAPSASAANGSSFSAPITGTGVSCGSGSNCYLQFYFHLGGADAKYLGLSYSSVSNGNADPFVGAALFGKGGAYVPPGPVTVGPLAGNTVGNLLGVQLTKTGTTFAGKTDTAGYRASFDSSTKLLDVTPATTSTQQTTGTSTETDTGHYLDESAWSTWREGGLGAGNFNSWVLLRPITATRLPIIGTFVTYYMKAGAGLAPTRSNGTSLISGTATGEATVYFNTESSAKFGMTLNTVMNDKTYAWQTSGGTISPGIVLQRYRVGDGYGFTANLSMNTQDTLGGLCSGIWCRASGSIVVGGTTADQVVVSYGTTNHVDANNNFGGVAVFTKDHATIPTPPTPTPTTVTPLAAATVSDMVGLQIRRTGGVWETNFNTQGYSTKFDAATTIQQIGENATSQTYLADDYTKSSEGHDGDSAAWLSWKNKYGTNQNMLTSWAFLRSIEASRIPAVGTTINYSLIDGAGMLPTSTSTSGTTVTGTMSGKAAVTISSSSSAKLGVDLDVVFKGLTYAFSTSWVSGVRKGAVSPTSQLDMRYIGNNLAFAGNLALSTLDNANGICAGSRCTTAGHAIVGGPNADHVAISFWMPTLDVANSFGGVAVFGKDTPAATSSIPTPASADWGRWTAPGAYVPPPTPVSADISGVVADRAQTQALTTPAERAQERLRATTGLDIRFER